LRLRRLASLLARSTRSPGPGRRDRPCAALLRVSVSQIRRTRGAGKIDRGHTCLAIEYFSHRVAITSSDEGSARSQARLTTGPNDWEDSSATLRYFQHRPGLILSKKRTSIPFRLALARDPGSSTPAGFAGSSLLEGSNGGEARIFLARRRAARRCQRGAGIRVACPRRSGNSQTGPEGFYRDGKDGPTR